MEAIKLYKRDNSPMARLGTTEYTGFLIGSIPKRCFGRAHPNNPDTEGAYQWFNHKGITYYEKPIVNI